MRRIATSRTDSAGCFKPSINSAVVAVNFFVPADVMAELADDPSEVVRGLVAWKASLQRDGELVVQGG